MYYILFYKTAEDYLEKRKSFRELHLAYATKALERGELVLAGALAEPPDGAILVFKGESPKAAEDFAKNDPYVLNGVIVDWNVRLWNVVIGS